MAITYEESAALMQDFTFRGRVKVACLKFASYILNEPPSTEGHSARIRWAQNATLNPDIASQTVQPSVVMDPSIQDKGKDATDAEVQSAVEGVVNKIL